MQYNKTCHFRYDFRTKLKQKLLKAKYNDIKASKIDIMINDIRFFLLDESEEFKIN